MSLRIMLHCDICYLSYRYKIYLDMEWTDFINCNLFLYVVHWHFIMSDSLHWQEVKLQVAKKNNVIYGEFIS